MNEIVIRDLRHKEKFQIDDEYLNGYAKVCGANATLVYLCLCRHADYYTQKSFPSIEKMSEKLGISIASVKRGISSLVEWNIIVKQRTRHPENAKWVNNSYTLLDKTVWKQKPQLTQSYGKPQLTDDESHGSHRYSKESHTKVTHNVAETSSAPVIMKGKKEKAPAVIIDFIEKMEKYQSSPQRHIEIIGLYMEYRKDSLKKKIKNSAQLKEFTSRHLKAAKRLADMEYSDDEIIGFFDEVDRKNRDIDWTVETVIKHVTK